MIPIGPLMREHRLIERMLELMKLQLGKIREANRADPVFIEVSTDFIRTYADRCHHGKEEDILFRDLEKKPLQEEHRTIMDELIAEHVHGREVVRKLIDAHKRHLDGEVEALQEIATSVQELIEFYPRHIFKEDKQFFYPCMEYFNKQELARMLEEFWDFDKKLVHEKYEQVVKTLKDRLTL
jgi:hemerythrin-like domain-containing protein